MTDPRRARYVALFAVETRSLLGAARRALSTWIDTPQESSPAEELFRVLHTIKGMAGSLDFATVVDLTHETETELGEMRGGTNGPDAAWFARMEASLDAITAEADAVLLAEGGVLEAGKPKAERGARIVRVDLDRLDALFADLGGLVTARQTLERHVAADPFAPVARAAGTMARRLDALQHRILEVRLAPLAEVFERVPPLVRNLARRLGKDVTVEISGEKLEVDRAILDQLLDPLLHLLRNAVDHGIESAEARLAAGKPAAGRVSVRARYDREIVVVDISDDGQGIDRGAVARQARASGMLADDTHLSDEDLLATLARPGFSTASSVTDVSGRGVGLDAVVSRLQDLGATMALTSVPGKGTLFSVRLPTRLGIVRALVTSVGDERYVLPLMHVAELVPCEPGSLSTQDGRATLAVRGKSHPVADLRRLVLYHGAAPPARRPAVILVAGDQRVALLTDAVHGQVDAVIQPVERTLGMPRWVTGSTVLDSGRPALLLDLASVV